MARIFSFLVLLIAAVYADEKHESKKKEDASSSDVASKGSTGPARKEHAKKETEPAEKSSKEATQGEGHAQPGDYQKFMKQFSGDYSKYMRSRSDSSSQSGDWKKYMEQYGGNSQGGNFEQYMDKYTGGQGASSMGSNYKQFMEEYAGGSQYRHYTKKYAGDYFSGDVSKYMAGNQGKKDQSASEPDFRQYMSKAATSPSFFLAMADSRVDDAKHKSKKYEDASSPWVASAETGSKEATKGEGNSPPGDYQKFMKQFSGDYSKYMGSRSDGSSQSGDWKKYLDQYAGQGDSSQGGDFKQFMDKYSGGQGTSGMGGNYKQYTKQYAGDYFSGDVSKYVRAGQGKKGESASKPDFHQYMQQDAASPSFFLAAPDSGVNPKQGRAAAEAVELQTAEGDAASRAQHHVEELKALAAEMEANMKSNAANMASSIESTAREEFGDQRKQLQHDWVAKLKALNATELAAAKWDDVETAFGAAADAENQLRNLDWEEFKAMRHAYHERHEAKQSHVRSLAHEARKASHEAKHLGRNVEDRQQTAGVKEHLYEREWAHSEHASEGLAREAEKAGEAAQEAVEREFEHVEDHLEKRLDALKEAAAKEHKVRKEAEAKAKKNVVEARNAVHQHAESQASAGSPTLFVELAAADTTDQVAAGDDQEPSAWEKPSKQEIAQQRLGEATQQTEGIVSELEQLATREHENVEKNAEDTVKVIIASAHEKGHEHRQQVEQEWQENLKALSAESLAQAEDEAVHRAFEAARHAQEKLSEVDHRQVDAEREACDHMRRKQDSEVRKLTEQARKSSDRMDELGRHLKNRDAEDKAGRQSERLQREAEDAADKVEEDIDKKFRLVRDLLDKHMREEEKAAKKEQHDRRESRHRAEEAVHDARRALRSSSEEAQSKPASGPAAAFLASSAVANPLHSELLAGAAFCFSAITLIGVVYALRSRNVRLNEQPALG